MSAGFSGLMGRIDALKRATRILASEETTSPVAKAKLEQVDRHLEEAIGWAKEARAYEYRRIKEEGS